jgi:purine-binding chemotaxis protein CheW
MQQHATRRLLAFAIDRQRFAVDIGDVQEILRAVALARLPEAPTILEGLIDLRGTVVPMLDIRSRFRLPPKGLEPADHFVIVRANGRTVGLRVDRALDLLILDNRDIDDIGEVAATSEYVSGVARLRSGLVLIHDLGTFLSEAESEALDGVVAGGVPS